MADNHKTRVKLVKADEYGPERVTQYNEFHYQRQGAGNWRLIDTSTSATIGPNYPSEKTLLADLDRQYRMRFTEFNPGPDGNWLDTIRDALTELAAYYDKSAPVVTTWANDLYIRINEAPDTVPLSELLAVAAFREDGTWEHPNYAANRLYKLLHRLGRDTTGTAGF